VKNTSRTTFTWLIIAISGMAISYSGLYIVYEGGEQIRKGWFKGKDFGGQVNQESDLNDVDMLENDLICSCW